VRRCTTGFSLLELAVVLTIVGMVLGGLLGRLGASHEQRQIARSDAALALAYEALMGFAVTHGRLPCADQDGDGAEDCPGGAEGDLPWRSLGLTVAQSRDAWHTRLRYRADGGFSIAIGDPPATVDGLRVSDADGNPLTAGNPMAPAAILLSLGKDGTGNGANGTPDTHYTQASWCTNGCVGYFDDRLLIVSGNVLIARLAAAGRWP
jgi:prepilin-type N-terminal cleavage/methylation domain-containing protein